MKKRKQKIPKTLKAFSFFIIVFIGFSLFSCERKFKEFSRMGFSLGTVCQIKFFADLSKPEANSLLDEIFLELENLDKIFNANTNSYDSKLSKTFKPEFSELEKVNQNAGIKPVSVSKELFEILEISLYIAQKSDSAFNPAVGALVKLWDIGFSATESPSHEDIESTLPLINYKDILLKKNIRANNLIEYSVFLSKKGMRLDLGGIAKGYAADKVVSILKKAGIKDALIDIGGNIFALGKKQNAKAWTAGIKNPNIGENGIAASIKLSDKSLVSSGNYERYFKENGKLYHHILDSKTGYPVENKLNAVSVVAKKSVYADILSTTCFVLGEEKSRKLINDFNKSKQTSISVFFFYNDNSIKLIGNSKVDFQAIKPFKAITEIK